MVGERAAGGEDPDAAATGGDGLEGTAVRAVGLQVVSFGGNRLVTFASTLVLARLLDPHEFGLFAGALTFTLYLQVLLDFGVGSYLVYDQDPSDTDQVDVAFTFNLILTVALTVAAVALSPVSSRLFGASGHTGVFAAMAAFLLLVGLSEINGSLIERDLQFRKLVVIDLTNAVVRAGLSVGLAAAGLGVWALAVGLLAGQAVSTVAAFALVRYRPRIRFDWSRGRAMLRYGASSVALDALNELTINADYLVVAAVAGATALGWYTIACRLPDLVVSNVFWIFSGVAFPLYARSRHRGPDVLRAAVLRALRLITLYGFAASVGLALVAPAAITVLFGDQWRQAILPMEALSLAAGLASTTYASGPLYPAIGRPGALVRINIPVTVLSVAGYVLAAPHGIVWVAVVHLVRDAVMAVVRLVIANRVAGTTNRQNLVAMGPAVAAAAGVAAVDLPLRLLLAPGPGTLATLVVGGLLGAAAALALLARPTVRELWGLASGLRPTSTATS